MSNSPLIDQPETMVSDRGFFCEMRLHGAAGEFELDTSLDFGDVRTEDTAEQSMAQSIQVHKSSHGTRVWLTPIEAARFFAHFPIAVPSEVLIGRDQGASTAGLYLGALSVDARVLAGSGTLAAVRAYSGSTRIASFGGLGRSQLTHFDSFRLTEIQSVRNGLDIVVEMGWGRTGEPAGFEFESVGATLVTDRRQHVLAEA